MTVIADMHRTAAIISSVAVRGAGAHVLAIADVEYVTVRVVEGTACIAITNKGFL